VSSRGNIGSRGRRLERALPALPGRSRDARRRGRAPPAGPDADRLGPFRRRLCGAGVSRKKGPTRRPAQMRQLALVVLGEDRGGDM